MILIVRAGVIPWLVNRCNLLSYTVKASEKSRPIKGLVACAMLLILISYRRCCIATHYKWMISFGFLDKSLEIALDFHPNEVFNYVGNNIIYKN